MVSNHSRTRTWSVATSPRSPQKLPNELGLLATSFDGRIWDSDAQHSFAQQLARAEFFEGRGSSTEPAFSARDRVTRAPKALGFIRLDGSPRRITILPFGRRLIERQNLPDLFLHQLLKWQYPSPVMARNRKNDYIDLFYIKPFLECLRLACELDGISKEELAIFAVPFIDYREYDDVRDAILNFRELLSNVSGQEAQDDFMLQASVDRLQEVYRDDIRAGRIATREQGGRIRTVENFLLTKARNLRDYADSAMRYFRATGLFTNSSSTLQLVEERTREVDLILAEVRRDPEPYHDVEAYYDYLGNPDVPVLPGEDPGMLRNVRTDRR